MSSQGPSSSDTAGGTSPAKAAPSSPIGIPATDVIPRSEPISILPGFQAAKAQPRPMASSAPGRFNWQNENPDGLDILGSSPPDKNKIKFNKW